MLSTGPMETEEDVLLVKKHILLVTLLDVLDRDTARLSGALAGGIVSAHVQHYLRSLQDKVGLELVKIRKGMRQRGIKVTETSRTAKGIEARYLCRGYQHQFTMLWSLVKAELIAVLLRLREGRAIHLE